MADGKDSMSSFSPVGKIHNEDNRPGLCVNCRMFETPDYSHLTKSSIFEEIYEPAEDTFLLLDAIEKDYKNIKSIKPLVCLEVGCGSGIVITFLAKTFGSNLFYLATDINPIAAKATRETGLQNGVSIEVFISNLGDAMLPRLTGLIDVIVFNPPYVVTPSTEVGCGGLSASWAGGKDGREVTDQFLNLVPHFLSKQGILYLVIIKENKQDEIESILQKHGFSMEIIISRRSGPEFLSVLKFSRENLHTTPP
ncbi:unnamed protein product [Owenia fusiformis]|uniref:Methyltransferase HEMK2 n=1 Tax=Owenia fusiformis TaxID=6347 RepID=A0A8J1UBQ5_OWEFU|nr:unnamed protein product [Owenia fusiformis]